MRQRRKLGLMIYYRRCFQIERGFGVLDQVGVDLPVNEINPPAVGIELV